MLVKIRNPLYDKRHLYAAGVQKEFRIVEGELIATPKWVDYPAITVKTGVGRYDFSIIDKATIVEVIGETVDLSVSKPKFKVIEVTGSKGDIYTVTVGDKHSSCTCHAFQFRKTCKHIREAVAA
ncbi:Zinc finger, SWIM-type [uncultured Caudovirales phage]|uniref:Zinc finger, SWIM-type n=1 Tax=uncultured Caudovirales phage TaxID=2100421 RepID=A0A6J7WT23_9CAUD|nr:Zinc finger, SWIM-type [uncultured Caudovirales phage]